MIQYFVDRKEVIVAIDCGFYHSHCRSAEEKYYLFGSNHYNECLAFNQQDKVREPFCINGVIQERLDGKRIKSISLGVQNTKIVVFV